MYHVVLWSTQSTTQKHTILLKVFVLFLGDKPMERESIKEIINNIAKSWKAIINGPAALHWWIQVKTQFRKKNFKTLGFKNEKDLPVTVEQMNVVSPSSSVCLHNQNPGGSQSIISSTLHCDLSLVSTLDKSVFWEWGVFDLF